MTRHTLAVTTIGDVLIAGKPEASHRRAGLVRVPGSQIRGVFAKRWIDSRGIVPNDANPALRQEFIELFHGAIRWPSLCPPGLIIEPISALVHKGGRPFDCDDSTAQPIDLAYDDAPTNLRCGCGTTLELGRGDRVISAESRLETRTRVGLENQGSRRERAKDSMLFSREGFAGHHKVTLKGQLHSPAPLPTWLEEQLGEVFEARIGGQRSVDGKVSVRLGAATRDQVVPEPIDDGRIVLRAMSPTVLVDECGCPSVDPLISDLWPIAGTYEIAARWIRSDLVGGWDAIAGLPRPEDVAVAAGSTWLLKPTDPSRIADPHELADLQQTLDAGLGMRREVGYGEVVVNPPRFTEHAAAAERPRPVRTGPVTDAFRALEPALAFLNPTETRWLAGHLSDAARHEAMGQPSPLGTTVSFSRLHGRVQNQVKSRGGDEPSRIEQLSSENKKILADVIEATLVGQADPVGGQQ